MAKQAILGDQQLEVLKELSGLKDFVRKEVGVPLLRAVVENPDIYIDYIHKQQYVFGPTGVVVADPKKSVTMHPLCFLGRGAALKAFIDIIDEQSSGLSPYVVELDSGKNNGLFLANNHGQARLGKVACRCNLKLTDHEPTCLCAKALVYWNVDTLSQWSYVDITNFLLRKEGRVIFFARLRMNTANGSFPKVPHGNIMHEVSWVTVGGALRVTLNDKGQPKVYTEVPYHFVYNYPENNHVVHSAQGLATLTGQSVYFNGVYDIIMLTASIEANIVVSSLSSTAQDEPKLIPQVSSITEVKNTILRLGDTPSVASVCLKKLAGDIKEEESMLATLSLARQAATYEVNLNSKFVNGYFNDRTLGGMVLNGWLKWYCEIMGSAQTKVRVVGFKTYKQLPEVIGVLTLHFLIDYTIEQVGIVTDCHDVYGVSRLHRNYIWYSCDSNSWLSYLHWFHKEKPLIYSSGLDLVTAVKNSLFNSLNSVMLSTQWVLQSTMEEKFKYYLTYQPYVKEQPVHYSWGQIFLILWFVTRVLQFSFKNVVVVQQAMSVYYKPAVGWSWMKGWTVSDTLFADSPKTQVSLSSEVDDFYASDTGTFEPYLVYKTNTNGSPEDLPLREGTELAPPKCQLDKIKVGFAVLGIQMLPLPMMHSGEVHNQGMALAGRLCKPCKFKSDPEFIQTEFDVTLRNLDKFFGVVDFYSGSIGAKISFNTWLKTFSSSKAKSYLKGYDVHTPSPQDAQSGMLVKCELLNKAVETKMPRAIISSTPAYNRITGPEMATIYLFMKAVWNVDANVYIAGGTETAEIYGARFEQLFDNLGFQTIDGDFTDYDASQKEEVFAFLGAIYEEIGISYEASNLMDQKVTKIGYSSNGWRFKVDASRGSGETDTLVGNCILTAHSIFSALALHKGITLQELYDLLPKPQNTMADVNLIINDICNHIEAALSDQFGVLACENDYDTNPVYFKNVVKFNTVRTVSEAMTRHKIIWHQHKWFYMDVLGDDNLTYLPNDVVVNTSKFELASNKYGMQNNATLTKDPSIMSSRFWKVNGHRILGPRPGRIIPKLACLSKPYSYVGGEQMDLMEGIAMKALGCKTDSLFIPILRAVVDKVYELGGSEKVGLQKHLYKAHASKEHQCHPDTMLQFCELYSLSEQRVLEIEDEIKSVGSLPYRIVSHDLETMYKVDN